MAREILLIIDPQQSFCEAENGIGGELAVVGGRAALKRIASMIDRYGSKLDDIIITLDCHNPLHIAHPIWFQDENERPLAPFTTVVEDKGEMLYGSLDASGFHAKGKARCLFDVQVGDWWLRRADVEDVARKLGLMPTDIVPIVGQGTLIDMVHLVSTKSFQSQWDGAKPEGIVARPATELRTRSGELVITKLKFKDFR